MESIARITMSQNAITTPNTPRPIGDCGTRTRHLGFVAGGVTAGANGAEISGTSAMGFQSGHPCWQTKLCMVISPASSLRRSSAVENGPRVEMPSVRKNSWEISGSPARTPADDEAEADVPESTRESMSATLFRIRVEARPNIPHTERLLLKTAVRGQEPRQTVRPVPAATTRPNQLRRVRQAARRFSLHVVSAGKRRAERHVGEDGRRVETIEGGCQGCVWKGQLTG